MKKTLICLVMVAFVCSTALHSTQEKVDLDDYDGKFWTDMEGLSKVYFLEGFLQGIKAVYYKTKEIKEAYSDPDIADAKDKQAAEVMGFILEEIKYYFNVFGLSYGDLQKGLDAVYKDEENRVIPIHRVLTPVAENIRGEISDDLLKDYIAELRDEYTK